MLKQSLLISFGIFAAVYFLFSYSLWELNPANWQQGERAISMIISILFSTVINLIINDMEK